MQQPAGGCELPEWPALDAREIDTFILDQDGVLFYGASPIAGSLETVQKMLRAGKRVFYVTNNSGISRAEFAAKLARSGIENVDKDHILTAGVAAARHLANLKVGSAYVIGEQGLVDELELAGIKCSGGPKCDEITVSEHDFVQLFNPPDSVPAGSAHSGRGFYEAVVVGLDTHFTYAKLTRASAAVQQGALFVGTNPDAGDRHGAGLMPGAGALIAAVESASGKTAVVVGKPSPTLLNHLIVDYKLDPERCCMVGDRLDTDIAFGNAGCVRTCLVLTGVATAPEANALPPGHPHRPHHVLPSLSCITGLD